MSFYEGLWAFAKAIIVGSFVTALVVAATFLAGGLITTGPQLGIIPLVTAAFLTAALFAFGFALLGAVFIGLPTTAILSRMGAESEFNYVAVGGAAGIVLALIALVLIDASGMFAAVMVLAPVVGGIMGRTWWRSYRQHNSAD